ncbi:MAG: T9SS type A sorting domain-containing protein [Flavobacteriales bacterium]|nr:T9SS type A sorting domain-containing protein [Flavobacteriales bacterium]
MKYSTLLLFSIVAFIGNSQTLSFEENLLPTNVGYNVFPTFNHIPVEPYEGDITELFLSGFDASQLQAPENILAVQETQMFIEDQTWTVEFTQAGNSFVRVYEVIETGLFQTYVEVDIADSPQNIINNLDPGRLLFDTTVQSGDSLVTQYDLEDENFNVIQPITLTWTWYDSVSITSFGNTEAGLPSAVYSDLILMVEKVVPGDPNDNIPDPELIEWYFYSPDNLLQPLFGAQTSDQHGFVWHEFAITTPTASIQPIEDAKLIEAYPVPFEDQLKVRFEYPSSLELIDAMGRTILRKLNESLIHELELGDLESGVYYLKNDKGEVLRVVKK